MPETTQIFRISIHFLNGTFHGQKDGGENEWPPSPLRLFETLVNAAARIGFQAPQIDALRWLETQPPPAIYTPPLSAIQPPEKGYKTYVPDNVGDLVANSWCKNHENDIANYRTEKQIRPIALAANAAAIPLSYQWEIAAADRPFAESLIPAARAISAFGWGIDLVASNAEILPAADSKTAKTAAKTSTASAADSGTAPSSDAANPTLAIRGESPANLAPAAPVGTRYLPAPETAASGNALRVPTEGTFDALRTRYDAFCTRISLAENSVFQPVPPLAQFKIVTYRSDIEIPAPHYAVFAIRTLDDTHFASFDTARRALHVAAMCRHIAASAEFIRAVAWTPQQAATALGHTPQTSGTLDFIPLPSVEWQGDEKGTTIGAIRRVLVRMPAETPRAEFDRVTRFLEGGELINEKTGTACAFLRRERRPEQLDAIKRYLTKATTWTTVTPVILPGFDDKGGDRAKLRDPANPLSVAEKHAIVSRLERRTEYLLRKALRQSGIPDALAAAAQLEWRGSGFIQGVPLTTHYAVPSQHRRYRRLHLRITWRTPDAAPLPLPGPLTLGSGRHTGLGLLLAER